MYFISRPLSQIASTICVSYDAAVLILYTYQDNTGIDTSVYH